MAGVRLARRAQADLRALLAASRARQGVDGEARYAATLAAAIEMIVAAPEGPNTRRRAELGAGVRCLHSRRVRGLTGVRAPVHVVYYRVGATGVVEILAVVHERMDPARHLDGPAPRRRPSKRAR